MNPRSAFILNAACCGHPVRTANETLKKRRGTTCPPHEADKMSALLNQPLRRVPCAQERVHPERCLLRTSCPQGQRNTKEKKGDNMSPPRSRQNVGAPESTTPQSALRSGARSSCTLPAADILSALPVAGTSCPSPSGGTSCPPAHETPKKRTGGKSVAPPPANMSVLPSPTKENVLRKTRRCFSVPPTKAAWRNW